ncbi:MAG: peptide chain release factor H [Desulfobacterales bacterium]|nr:peptide chain release factor H [Desulfobacterales bacterium]
MTHWIQVSSGRGPDECCWVAARVAYQILTEAQKENIDAVFIKAVPGRFKNTFKSVLISVEESAGINGFLSRWQGTVKWIGTSRYRPDHKRKNWFVSCEVFSPVPQREWRANEFKFETMRSSGPGGQHANKTESAVRVTHLPTGLSAVASEERSQHINKKLAMGRLGRILQKQNEDSQKQSVQQQWHHHNSLVRGNAVRVFKGQAFNEKQ